MGQLHYFKKDRNYKSGFFHPRHPEKLLGNDKFAIYRSSLELKYFRILDENPYVEKWGSEEIVVPYEFANQWHKYYVDLVVFFKCGDELKKFWIELKPYSKCSPPTKSPRKKEKTYMMECFTWAKNQAKWRSAEEYAKKAGCEFRILTEKDLEKS